MFWGISNRYWYNKSILNVYVSESSMKSVQKDVLKEGRGYERVQRVSCKIPDEKVRRQLRSSAIILWKAKVSNLKVHRYHLWFIIVYLGWFDRSLLCLSWGMCKKDVIRGGEKGVESWRGWRVRGESTTIIFHIKGMKEGGQDLQHNSHETSFANRP